VFALHCWKTFQAKNTHHTNNLRDMGFNGVRIFLDLAYLPQGVTLYSISAHWQAYIDSFVKSKPDNMTPWTFEDFEKPFWAADPNDSFKDNLDMCKDLNWLPVICIGYREEPVESYTWINRSPEGGQIAWLKRFAQELAIYLKNVYQFTRCDMEVWNEPNEAMTAFKYETVATNMCQGWKTGAPEYKTHVFGCDIRHQDYLDVILQSEVLLKYVDYISPHILTYEEWPMLDGTYNKIKSVGKKMSLLEISPLDNMSRMLNTVGKCDMYGLLLGIRNSNIGTAFDITDLLVYDFDNPSHFIAIAIDKMTWLRNFNLKYANETLPEDEMIKLEKYYYRLKVTYNRDPQHVGVKMIQDCLGLKTDGVFGLKTENSVRAYQLSKGLPEDGIVGPETFKALIADYPRIYDEMIYNVAIGFW